MLRPFTDEERVKAGQTKREQLEEEFGLPFEKAKALRATYYSQGYEAGRKAAGKTMRELKAENESLRARLEGLASKIREHGSQRAA